MKKLFFIVLLLALLLALSACGNTEVPAESTPAPSAEPTPKPTAAPTVETWRGLVRGMDLSLALSSDGAYTLCIAGSTQRGTWKARDAYICLDGEETISLTRIDELLYWQDAGFFFGQDEPETGAYVPADLLTGEVNAETFNGYWTCLYVSADGAILTAEDMGDTTDLYVEAPRAALGGPLFGDTSVEMRFSGGALRFEADGVSVAQQLQSDGLMRMSLKAPDSDMTLYMVSTYVEGLSPAAKES